jgi:histidyl-tRNA synthetase
MAASAPAASNDTAATTLVAAAPPPAPTNSSPFGGAGHGAGAGIGAGAGSNSVLNTTEGITGSTMKQAKVKLQKIPGFPELSVEEELVMQQIMQNIREVYSTYGYVPLDTRLIEQSSVLFQKGISGKEVYALGRIHDNQLDMGKSTRKILALRFDLTVPLARYVAQNKSELNFPFRRYHIAKVYRGEHAKEASGRYREFYQSDIDVIGSNNILSLRYDSEFPAIIYNIFHDVIGIENFVMRINNRKVLEGLFIQHGMTTVENIKKAVKIIDNMEKVPIEATLQELENVGLSYDSAQSILMFFNLCRYNNPLVVTAALKTCKFDNPLLMEGISEIHEVMEGVYANGVPLRFVQFDPSIARGLDYYTGTVYETNLTDFPELGSFCSGGRYDKLVSTLTGNNNDKYPGCGISIGLSRLVPALIRGGVLSATNKTPCPVIVLTQDQDKCMLMYQKMAAQIRAAGINCDIFLNGNKFRSQLNYADKNGFDIAILGRSKEIDAGNIILKYLREEKSRQTTVKISDLVPTIKEYLTSQEATGTTGEEETKGVDASEFEDQVSYMSQRITSLFQPISPSAVNVMVHSDKIDLSTYHTTVKSGDVTVFWYVGSRGLKSGSVDLYKEPIKKIINAGGYVYLLDLTAWSAFFFKGGSVKKAHSFRNSPRLRMLHTNGFFRNLIGKMQTDRYTKILTLIFQDKTFYNVSEGFDDHDVTLADVFGEDSSVIKSFIDPSMDTGKCYSAFQFVEMLYVMDTITSQVVRNSLNVNFVLPNDEAKYYTHNGDTAMLQDMLEQYLTIKDTKVELNLFSFKYGENTSDRPYNTGTRARTNSK